MRSWVSGKKQGFSSSERESKVKFSLNSESPGMSAGLDAF